MVRQAMWTKVGDISAGPPAKSHALQLDSGDPCPAVVQASSFLVEWRPKGTSRQRQAIASSSMDDPSDIFEMDLIAAVAVDVSEAGGRCCWFFRWYGPELRTLRLGDNFFRHASQVVSVDSSSCRGPGRPFLLLSSSFRFPFATRTLRPTLVRQGTV